MNFEGTYYFSFQGRKWRQFIHMKLCQISTILHGIIYQKTVFIITTMRSSTLPHEVNNWIFAAYCYFSHLLGPYILKPKWHLSWQFYRPHTSPKLKLANFCQKVITIDNSKHFYCYDMNASSRNCCLIKSRNKIEGAPRWLPGLHVLSYSQCTSTLVWHVVLVGCNAKWLHLRLCVF